MNNSDYIYVTLISSIDYVNGTLVLDSSLKKVNSKYPLLVLVSKDENSPVIIKNLISHQIKFKILDNKFKLPPEVSKGIQSKRWIKTFDKLQVFGLTSFKRIIFLDSDILIIRNIDHLFKRPNLSFATASEQVIGFESWKLPNSGMMVLAPDKDLPKKIFETWPAVYHRKKDFGDQDLIHEYYKALILENDHWRVPATYNAFVFLLDKIIKEKGYNLNLNRPNEFTISVLHFAIKERPWLMSSKGKFLFYLDRVIQRKFKEIKAYRLYFRLLSKI